MVSRAPFDEDFTARACNWSNYFQTRPRGLRLSAFLMAMNQETNSRAADAVERTQSTLRAYVGMGSNLGDRAGHLLLAVRGMLDAGLGVRRLSSLYETEPVDVREQPPFLNMVAELEGELPGPEQLLARLLRVEYSLGRRRDVPRGPRTIDLDLLLYDGERRETEFLMLPHPRLHLRRFVLTPLAELAPRLQHPTLHQTIEQLLAETPDSSLVQKWRG